MLFDQILSEKLDILCLLGTLSAAVIAVSGPTNACYLFINSIEEGCIECNRQKGFATRLCLAPEYDTPSFTGDFPVSVVAAVPALLWHPLSISSLFAVAVEYYERVC